MAKRNSTSITYRGYFHLPDKMTESPDFISLSGSALKLLIDIGRQFNGRNNGDLCASRTILKDRGWNSNSKLSRAIAELVDKGWISKTKQGGMGIGPTLYAITWQPIHDCKGKLDVKATATPARQFN